MKRLDSGSTPSSLCVHFGFEHCTGDVRDKPCPSSTSVLWPSGQTKTNSFARGFTSDALNTIPETLVIFPITSALI